MQRTPIALALSLTGLLAGCGSAPPGQGNASSNEATPATEPTEQRLFRWLVGRYDSKNQAAAAVSGLPCQSSVNVNNRWRRRARR